MPEEYHLKLNPIIKQIVKFFADYDKSELKKGKTASSYLKPIIYAEINRMLDILNKERRVNAKLREDLKRDENKRILKFLDEDIRFK